MGICRIGNCWFDDVKIIVIGEAVSGSLLHEIAFLGRIYYSANSLLPLEYEENENDLTLFT